MQQLSDSRGFYEYEFLLFNKRVLNIICRGILQEALLKVDWPPELLRHPACETWIMAGQTMFRGPRLKVGMAQGPVLSKHPSSVTGRAVYRGTELPL